MNDSRNDNRNDNRNSNSNRYKGRPYRKNQSGTGSSNNNRYYGKSNRPNNPVSIKKDEQQNRQTARGPGGQHHPNHTNHPNRKRRQRPYTHGRPSMEAISNKFYNLWEQYLSARKKYFEQYFRVDQAEKRRLEVHYHRTIEQIEYFRNSLSLHQLELLNKRQDPYPLDLTYSSNHQLPSKGDYVRSGQNFGDPHQLPTQQQAAYKNDREESAGTFGDYQKLKNQVSG